MSEFLQQLVNRNVAASPLAVRPRLLSRFEMEEGDSPAPEQDFGTDQQPPIFSETEAVSQQPVNTTTDAAQREVIEVRSVIESDRANAGQAGPTIPIDIEDAQPTQPTPQADASDEISSQLQAMHDRIDGMRPAAGVIPVQPRSLQPHDGILADRMDSIEWAMRRSPGNEPADDSADVTPQIHNYNTHSVTEQTLDDTQHHHSVEQIDRTEYVDQSKHQTTTIHHQDLATRPTTPQIIPTESNERRLSPENAAPPTSESAHAKLTADINTEIPQIKVTAPRPAPAEHVDAASANAQRDVPKIAVEQPTIPNESHHTVTVTIGRIEVRPPAKPAPTKPMRRQPAARIMSLDDYMRRSAGGAG